MQPVGPQLARQCDMSEWPNDTLCCMGIRPHSAASTNLRDNAFNNFAHFRVAEPSLGLALKLRLRHLNDKSGY